MSRLVPVAGNWSRAVQRLRPLGGRWCDGFLYVPAERLAEAEGIVAEENARSYMEERPGWTFGARKEGERCRGCGREGLCGLRDPRGVFWCARCGDSKQG